jgi:hypothetical protein
MQLLSLDETKITSISYGLMASFGFMLMLFVYHYCKFNTMPRPTDTESQLDAAIIDTSMSIPFMQRFMDWIDSWHPVAASDAEPEELFLKPERRSEPAKTPVINGFIVRRSIANIRPLQPKRTVSCPAALYVGAAAFSPASEDGDFFFADLPSPASAP